MRSQAEARASLLVRVGSSPCGTDILSVAHEPIDRRASVAEQALARARVQYAYIGLPVRVEYLVLLTVLPLEPFHAELATD